MTATERLRALLDERGVEWGKALTDLSRQTHWSTERYWCAFTEWNGTVGIADTLTIYHVSPEQAVEATLGRGTCKYDFVSSIGNGFLDACGLKCSCCGREQMSMDAPKFCPDCGRRVDV